MKRKLQEVDAGEKPASSPSSSSAIGTSMNTTDIVLQTSSPKLSQKQDYIFHGGDSFKLNPKISLLFWVPFFKNLVCEGRRHVRPYYFEFISHVSLLFLNLSFFTVRLKLVGHFVRWINAGRGKQSWTCSLMNSKADLVTTMYVPLSNAFKSRKVFRFWFKLLQVGAVKCGRIKVDGETVPVSYIVKSSQKITHFVHRLLLKLVFF